MRPEQLGFIRHPPCIPFTCHTPKRLDIYTGLAYNFTFLFYSLGFLLESIVGCTKVTGHFIDTDD